MEPRNRIRGRLSLLLGLLSLLLVSMEPRNRIRGRAWVRLRVRAGRRVPSQWSPETGFGEGQSVALNNSLDRKMSQWSPETGFGEGSC